MIKVIDMQGIRYINLFERVTRIPTRYFFMYNESVVFCVPKDIVSKAIGKEGVNVKKLNQIVGKKIKVIASPEGESKEAIQKFLENAISPNRFNELNIEGSMVIVNAGSQNKAALIGRNKRRFLELQKIVADYFGKDLKII